MADAASTNEAVQRIIAHHVENIKLANKSKGEKFDSTAGTPNPVAEAHKRLGIRQKDLR
jgi:hypothetical protein